MKTQLHGTFLYSAKGYVCILVTLRLDVAIATAAPAVAAAARCHRRAVALVCNYFAIHLHSQPPNLYQTAREYY